MVTDIEVDVRDLEASCAAAIRKVDGAIQQQGHSVKLTALWKDLESLMHGSAVGEKGVAGDGKGY